MKPDPLVILEGTLVGEEPEGLVVNRDRTGGFCIWIRRDALV